jgi:hypothetical protein
MKHIKLFESYFLAEDIATEIDNWIEDNSNYLSRHSLEEKIKELIRDKGTITAEEETIENKEGEQYSENWNTKVITVKLNGKDLVKVCTKSDGRYSYGASSNMFRDLPENKKGGVPSGRFYFDRTLLNTPIN